MRPAFNCTLAQWVAHLLFFYSSCLLSLSFAWEGIVLNAKSTLYYMYTHIVIYDCSPGNGWVYSFSEINLGQLVSSRFCSKKKSALLWLANIFLRVWLDIPHKIIYKRGIWEIRPSLSFFGRVEVPRKMNSIKLLRRRLDHSTSWERWHEYQNLFDYLTHLHFHFSSDFIPKRLFHSRLTQDISRTFTYSLSFLYREREKKKDSRRVFEIWHHRLILHTSLSFFSSSSLVSLK